MRTIIERIKMQYGYGLRRLIIDRDGSILEEHIVLFTE